ncbi:MAG: adenosylmethionine--8-amino-7-oxononanoate transaminase [Planctomycetes bacterium]|jgi:adenosylmethionine-8-amino-7-oxononanoate aminotransferase|nr:adenosylmethionine--8-amino-7-oxononanoate transaminase [Planctomycetota bacterium]MBV21856.1 adenosylmethionine--8-amino-7-oxononanoate transaminase [Planctomycetaceae bacterium]HJM58060.1 adenosylmethionine--8-amino-7-oxononanoate transaminase [Planctomycetota bacterium]
MKTAPSLAARDARHCWHPYTQHGAESDPPLAVASAKDALLTLEDGRELIDAISSWWAILHGHGREELIDAMERQARKLDHVLFAGATHEPAVRLAERLCEIAPAGLTRVFYSDDGSTAVEVALKMAYQRWVQRGEPDRRVFVALDGAYHGDTFGSMAVSDPDPFFAAYTPLLFEVRRCAPNPEALAALLDELGERAAGLIVEPMVQGAAGMCMHPASFLQAARALTRERGLPLIADEVMTGFGRTGRLFACNHGDVAPDLLCLAKGLTGGIFPLSATLATEEMFESFLSEDKARAFFHGHTFTAHPVGCAVALASLDITLGEDTPGKLNAIGETILGELRSLEGSAGVSNLRHLGGIVALDLSPPAGDQAGYMAKMAASLRAASIERGVLLRPLGNVLYAMPPACTTPAQARQIGLVMAEMALLPPSLGT